MNISITPAKANMSFYCSGEAKCVGIKREELNNETACPADNQLCNVLDMFVREYANEVDSAFKDSEEAFAL